MPRLVFLAVNALGKRRPARSSDEFADFLLEIAKHYSIADTGFGFDSAAIELRIWCKRPD
jgi:hypothetical protein